MYTALYAVIVLVHLQRKKMNRSLSSFTFVFYPLLCHPLARKVPGTLEAQKAALWLSEGRGRQDVLGLMVTAVGAVGRVQWWMDPVW